MTHGRVLPVPHSVQPIPLSCNRNGSCFFGDWCLDQEPQRRSWLSWLDAQPSGTASRISSGHAQIMNALREALDQVLIRWHLKGLAI